MMKILYLLFLWFPLEASVASELTYSRACAAGQCGDWKQAQQQMSNLVIDNPDDPELLYDNGVAAYRLNEFEKAQAYFADVAKNKESSLSLRKQAYFNLGNTHVGLQELPEAIKDYEAVLEIDPNDERAKHNLQKVAELLAQQKQEQQEQNQDSNADQQEGQKDQAGQNQQQKQSGKDGDLGQQEQQGNNQQGEQSHNQSSKQNEQGESDSNQQGDEEHQSHNESTGQDQNEQQDQFGNGHDNSPEDDVSETNDAHNVASEQQKRQQSDDDQIAQEQNAIMQADDTELDKDMREEEQKQLRQKFAPNEQWMARLLQRRDKADEQANKQLIKATVDKNLAGTHGQNNW